MDPRTGTGGGSWTWDGSLYAGSARFYAAGRAPYPPELAGVLADALGLDGSGRLLDVGCGPGSLTLLLAPHVAEAIGVDADADMLAEAARLAEQQGVRNAVWRHLRAEQLPADLPRVHLVTFAQSFHWTDRPRVAAAVRGMLEPSGVLVHVHATTHRGVDADVELPFPRPPHAEIARLVEGFLGPVRRAGRGVLPHGTAGGEDEVYRAAGFARSARFELAGRPLDRSPDEVVASVYSLSWAAPHLFGARLGEFDDALRRLLARAGERFSEQLAPVVLEVWAPDADGPRRRPSAGK